MTLANMQKRLGTVHTEAIAMAVQHAVRQARMAARGAFARTLVRHLPGTASHIWVDWSLLRDDEVQLLSEERG